MLTQGQVGRPHLEAVSKEVGVGNAPGQRPELHDANEAGQVEHLALEILAVLHTAEVEQLGPVIDLRPEPCLQMVGACSF